MSVLYLDHFSLGADPFRITPDTAFFFTGGQRGDILEGLVVASMHDEGIISVVGEIGMGKTMLSRMLLDRLRPLPADTVYLANPVFDRDEILGAIAHDLMPEPPQGNRAQMLAALEAVLIARYSQGRRVVVVIDEAHSMPASTLEEIRLLSNLETTQSKLLKIVLFGQPELDELLAAPQLRQVKDRISHRFELQPLSATEVSAYLTFRLHKAGWTGGELFDPAAVKLLVQASEGRTRKLNMLADKSMLAAYAQGVPQVGIQQVRRAASDGSPHGTRHAAPPAEHKPARSAPAWQRFVPLGLAVLVALGIGYGVGAGAGYGSGRGSVQAGGEPALSATPAAASGGGAVPPAPATEQTQRASAPASPAADQPQPQPLTVAAVAAAALPAASGGGSIEAGPKPMLMAPGLAARLRDNSLAVRMQATDEFFATPTNQGFTVQLLSMRAPREAELLSEAMQIQAALDGAPPAQAGAPRADVPVLVHNRLYQGQLFHALYVGHFESRQAALDFIQSSPPAVRRYKSLVRGLDVIREEPAP
ncbi:MAG: ExeA family protein [Polaromonas sp.]